jgi:hypothetical protein
MKWFTIGAPQTMATFSSGYFPAQHDAILVHNLS